MKKKRNGNDLISTIGYVIMGILMIVSLFIPYPYFFIPFGLGLLILGYCLFRVLSTNVEKRQYEVKSLSYKFLKLMRTDMSMYDKPRKIKSLVIGEKIDNDEDHVLARCPYCDKKIRLPNKKGKHGVDCPNCHHHFKIKIK